MMTVNEEGRCLKHDTTMCGVFADYSEEKELEDWVGLIHQTIHKMKPRMISYAGISWLEDIMRKCQNVFGYGVSTS